MEQEGVCWVCGAGDFTPRFFHPKNNDLVIAADGGYHHLETMGIEPHVVLGDFDSLRTAPGEDAIVYPPQKDDTDLLIALRYGLKQQFTRFFIYGALGGARLSHTVANMQALLFLRLCHGHGFFIGEDTIVTAISQESAVFAQDSRGFLSVFSMGEEARHVYLSGVKYPLSNAVLSNVFPLGVSNELLCGQEQARVGVGEGALLLIWEDASSHMDKITFHPFTTV